MNRPKAISLMLLALVAIACERPLSGPPASGGAEEVGTLAQGLVCGTGGDCGAGGSYCSTRQNCSDENASGNFCCQCDSVTRCGTDCLACSGANATTVRSTCSGNGAAAALNCIPQCRSGASNLDGNGVNGCEACTTSQSCGSDCRPCGMDHVTSATCANNSQPAATACQLTCASGWVNSDGDATNGCEGNCAAGRCGSDCRACEATNASANPCSGSPTSPAALACVPVCVAGARNLDGDGANGCELCNRGDACGSDCQPCPTGGPHTRGACAGNGTPAASSCTLACDPGWRDTDSNLTNGCEACAEGYWQDNPGSCKKCDVAQRCGFEAPGPFCVDCSAGSAKECVQGRCGCTSVADCANGFTCIGHACAKGCATDADCSGQRCCGTGNQLACVTPGAETCDWLDNDCDGQVDEDCHPGTPALDGGVGSAEDASIYACECSSFPGPSLALFAWLPLLARAARRRHLGEAS